MDTGERNDFIMKNIPLVRSRIKKIAPDAYKNQDLYEDLFQAGMLGFIEGMDHFRSEKGECISYCVYWIDAEIKRFIRKNRNIKIPGDVYYKAIKYKDLKENALYDDNEIQKMLGYNDKELQSCFIAHKVFLTNPSSGQGVHAIFSVNPERVIMRKELKKVLKQTLQSFGVNNQKIMVDYFGKEKNCAQIGRELNVSRQSIKRRKDLMLEKMRKDVNLLNFVH